MSPYMLVSWKSIEIVANFTYIDLAMKFQLCRSKEMSADFYQVSTLSLSRTRHLGKSD